MTDFLHLAGLGIAIFLGSIGGAIGFATLLDPQFLLELIRVLKEKR